jgi:hypothetical protein
MMEKMKKTLVCHGDSLTAACELDRRSIWPSLVENGLHPNAAGHRLMAAKTVEMLKDRFDVEQNE